MIDSTHLWNSRNLAVYNELKKSIFYLKPQRNNEVIDYFNSWLKIAIQVIVVRRDKIFFP